MVDLHTPVGKYAFDVAVAVGNRKYQHTAHGMTSAGKRKPWKAQASVMGSALGRGSNGSAAPRAVCTKVGGSFSAVGR